MKHSLLKITFFSFSLLLFFSLSSYKALTFNEKKTTIYPPSLAETFYNKLELKENMPLLTNKHIDKRALKRPSVPSNLWTEIKNNVDYESFKQDVIAIIPNFYTDSELQELIDLHIDKPHIPITKVAFKREVADLITNFGEAKLLPQINTMLTANGFEPFDN
jgi:hypothetical protein